MPIYLAFDSSAIVLMQVMILIINYPTLLFFLIANHYQLLSKLLRLLENLEEQDLGPSSKV